MHEHKGFDQPKNRHAGEKRGGNDRYPKREERPARGGFDRKKSQRPFRATDDHSPWKRK